MSESAPQQPEEVVPAATESASASSASPPPRRRRRWKRRLVIGLVLLLVILAAVVGFAPRIASVPAVHNYALAVAGSKLQGELQVEGLSLSWGGPIEVRGLQVLDAARQQVIHVERVAAEIGVWRLITSPLAFGEITIESPRVRIQQRSDGQVTLAQAFEPRTSSQSEPAETASPLPAPQGRLIVKGGVLEVVRDGLGSYEVTDVNGVVELDTLDEVVGTIDLALADGSKVAGEATLRRLVEQGRLRPLNASGTLRLATDRNVEIGPLAALVGQAGFAGRVALDVAATFDAGRVQGRFAVGVAGLQSASRAAADAATIDAELGGQVRWADNRLEADVDLTGEAGQAHVDLAYQHSDQPVDMSVDQILAAVLTGEALALPDFTLNARAGIDLARLGRAVPELGKVREGAQLTGGRLEIATLAISGGANPAASTAIELKEVAARLGDRVVRLEPIAFDLGATMTPGQGLQVRQLELRSNFAQVNGSGSVSELRATFAADLGRLQRELGQVFDLGAFELAGAVDGSVELRRASAEQIDVAATATAERLRYAADGRVLDLPRASVSHGGQLVLANHTLMRVTAREVKADLNGEVVASAAGWYDVQQGGFKADIGVSHGELAGLGSRAKGLGIDELARYAGTLRMQIGAERAAGTQPLRTRGELVVRDLAVDGTRVAEGDARVTWDGVQVAADGQVVEIATAQLVSTLAQLTATDVKFRAGDKLALEGKVGAAADLARCIQVLAPVAGWDKPPELAGQLALDMAGSAAGNAVTVAGRGRIENFVIGTGEKAIHEKQVQFVYDAQLDHANETLTISTCHLTSRPLTAEVTGTIGQYTSSLQLNLSGRYSASWEAITALLHQLAPATAGTVIITGSSASEFTLTGPARRSEVQPVFRGLASAVNVGWARAEVYGVTVGAAEAMLTLRNGQLKLARTVVPAAAGEVTLNGVVDFAPPDPTLNMAGRTQLLKNVAVTRELSAQLLSRINPIFLHVVNIEGRVNLRVQDVQAPLGSSLEHLGAGQGRLDFAGVKMQPGGLLAELLALAGLQAGSSYPVKIGALDFVMRDGRIRYDNLTLTFPADFDLRFRGSVGLDETLDLVVSVPVRAELLNRLGVKGPTLEYAQLLSGVRVDIPIVGTREKPRLDLAKVDVQALLRDVLLKEPGRRIEDLLRGRRGEESKQP